MKSNHFKKKGKEMMKDLEKLKSIFILLLALFMFIIITCCVGCIDDDDDQGISEVGNNEINSSTETTKPAQYIAGNNVNLITKSIDDTGGDITVSNTGTYLDGTQVIFPAGALKDGSDVTVGYNEGSVSFPEGVRASIDPQTLSIHVDGDSSFLQPVKVIKMK